MSNKKSKGVVVSNKQGLLYAIPADILKKYAVTKEDFDSVAEFFQSEEDDVSGQRMHEDFSLEEGVLGEGTLISRPMIRLTFKD